MSQWELRTASAFAKVARKLDPPALRRIKAYLDEVCELEDPRARGKGLTGDLAGYWRYRELVIVAVTMGHRSGVY